MIFIADFTFLTRLGLMDLIHKHELNHKVTCSASEDKLLEEVEYLNPNLVIIDPGSFTSETGDLGDLCKDRSVLVISDDFDKKKAKEWCDLGLKGLIPKTSSEDEIVAAIKMVMGGRTYFTPNLLDLILEEKHNKSSSIEDLSEREKEVLGRIAKGLSSNQIANELFLSIHTINSHRKNMMKKLGLKSPAQLVVFAVENGLVD